MELLQQKLDHIGVRTQRDLLLAKHSTFAIGGHAKLAVFPKTQEELLQTLEVANAYTKPLLIGKGSNVVFSDEGFDGVVIFTTDFREAVVSENQIEASAGYSLIALSNLAREKGLSGLEFSCGIPGTLGGAVYMNAGAFGGNMAQICVRSTCHDAKSNRVFTLCGEEQAFGVRTSIYANHSNYTVLGATLLLRADDRSAIDERMKEYKARRLKTQPQGLPNAGSVFKHPVGYFAGKLIQDCGLKGYSIGGAQVSDVHAGFIVNRGGATGADVRSLVEHIRACVLREYGVELECEIRFIPQSPTLL